MNDVTLMFSYRYLRSICLFLFFTYFCKEVRDWVCKCSSGKITISNVLVFVHKSSEVAFGLKDLICVRD